MISHFATKLQASHTEESIVTVVFLVFAGAICEAIVLCRIR
jgi:hypothetical protein